jgi:hypothetical protein
MGPSGPIATQLGPVDDLRLLGRIQGGGERRKTLDQASLGAHASGSDVAIGRQVLLELQPLAQANEGDVVGQGISHPIGGRTRM